jgi:hypothetical protein
MPPLLELVVVDPLELVVVFEDDAPVAPPDPWVVDPPPLLQETATTAAGMTRKEIR